jgi:hypothetical protein
VHFWPTASVLLHWFVPLQSSVPSHLHELLITDPFVVAQGLKAFPELTTLPFAS